MCQHLKITTQHFSEKELSFAVYFFGYVFTSNVCHFQWQENALQKMLPFQVATMLSLMKKLYLFKITECYFGVPKQKDVLKISCKSIVSNVMANTTVLNYAAACFKSHCCIKNQM